MEQNDGESATMKEDLALDMSLDDIIQLQKEEENDTLHDLSIEQQKNIKQYTFGNQEKRFQPNLQGVARLRRGLKPEVSGMKWKTIQTAGTGLSPLNRQGSWSMQVVKINNWPEKINRRRLQQKRAFRSPGIPARLYKRGPSLQSFQKVQRRSSFNLGRMFTQQSLNNRGTTKTQRRQAAPVFGSVLTVSVPNPKAGPKKAYIQKRPYAVGIKSPIQSKGVPLSFNVGSVANQTSYTLHERFSTLKTRRPFTTMTSRGRTVTLV